MRVSITASTNFNTTSNIPTPQVSVLPFGIRTNTTQNIYFGMEKFY